MSSIPNNIQNLLSQVNPSIDISDPIIKDLVINFAGNVWNDINNSILNIQNTYNASLLSTMSGSQLDSFAYSTKGMVRNPGSPVTGFVFVMTTDNSQDISIPVGTTFATSDGTWQYTSQIAVYVAMADVPNYYNPATAQYEFMLPVTAVANGTSYRVSSYRITTIGSPLSFAANVQNRAPTTGGKDPETDADFISRIQSVGAGFSINSSESIREQILGQIPDVTDVQFYKPNQAANVVKVYYIGTMAMQDTVTFQILPNLSTTFAFPTSYAPIAMVTAVIYQGVLIDSSQYAYNAWQFAVNLTSPEAGALIYCTIQYNGLSQTLQNFFFGAADIHQTQWVPIPATTVSFDIHAYVKIPSYLVGDEVTDSVTNSILETVNTGVFVDSINASSIATNLMALSPNLLDAQVTINGLPYISFQQGQYPQITQSNITITVI